MEKLRRKLTEIDEKIHDFSDLTADELVDHGLKDITLRPYQLDGVNWLVQRYHRDHGCILGDEMGLGKTCQTIAFLVYLHGSKQSTGPHMILCPLSVIANWQTEVAKFAPCLNLVTYLGDKDSRAELRHKIKKRKRQDGVFHFNILLTTYEICLKDEEFLQKIKWHTLVVDEAHRLKNQKSLLYQTLLQFEIDHHLLLTGTPVQNNLKELYSLLAFCANVVFKVRYEEEFVQTFTDASEKGVSELHDLLKPFLLRRIKAEVVKDLPFKSEVLLYHGLSDLQKKYYKAILTKDLEAFDNDSTSHPVNRTSLMNILMQLRKCVNHPYLFDGVEPEPFELGEHLVDASAKLITIDRLLAFLKPRGHKVLLFSQMTRMLDIIQDYLGYRGYSYERLDGSVRGEERFLAVKNFNEMDETFIFLLSTKAGGVGLNLTGADTVIFVDSDFNPQNDLQAAARAHRIGQTRPVKVIRLIGRSTVEEIVFRRAEAKLKLTNTVIEGGQFSLMPSKEARDKFIAENNLQLQDILKYGVDRLFEAKNDTDIDFKAILGPSLAGEWQLEEGPPDAATQEPELVEPDESVENMYVFEGKDYKTEPSAGDQKAFDDLLAAERALLEEASTEDRSTRKNRGTRAPILLPELPKLPKKPKKQLTPEELEERKKKKEEAAAKRKQAAERRAREEEEEEVRRAQEQKKKRDKLWAENDYETCNIWLESDEDSGSTDIEEEDEDNDVGPRQINYVMGDVTYPKEKHTKDKDAVIVHCVDDSGKWGRGGLFTALSTRSLEPEEQYEKAGKMRDLALGDVHLVSIDDIEARTTGKDYCALIVAQHRDRKNNLSGIKLSALTYGLKRIYKFASKKRATVHLPRIGHNTPGFNWYGTERLIRKYLVSKGIPTYVYYFPRRHAAKRRKSSDDEQSRKVKKKRKVTPDPETSDRSTPELPDAPVASTSGLVRTSTLADESLPNFLEGVNIHFYNIAPETCKRLTRYIMAYDGDIHRTVEDTTTFILVDDLTDEDKDDLHDINSEFKDAKILKLQWLEDCVKEMKKIEPSGYILSSG
ncbi:chromodomain-helicase-DNA-binding protein 1-like [Lineus longissimus]|uniref:chromodomain-helicase-DNA-binding protein 1-like n=1 Tax=Lineus longissimus TaxID=88925 RepID=UPI00315D1361